jgi:hypothetical protein
VNAPARTTDLGSELERRYQIRIDLIGRETGVVHVYDRETTPPEEMHGAIVFSTHTESGAEEIVRCFSKRDRDGNGWVLRQSWTGSGFDVGGMRHEMRVAWTHVLAERGRAW